MIGEIKVTLQASGGHKFGPLEIGRLPVFALHGLGDQLGAVLFHLGGHLLRQMFGQCAHAIHCRDP